MAGVNNGKGLLGGGVRLGELGGQQLERAPPGDAARVDSLSDSEYTSSCDDDEDYPFPYRSKFMEGGEEGWYEDEDMDDSDDSAALGTQGAETVISGAGLASRAPALHPVVAARGAGAPGASSGSNSVWSAAVADKGGVDATVPKRASLKWTEEMNDAFLDPVDEVGVNSMTAPEILQRTDDALHLKPTAGAQARAVNAAHAAAAPLVPAPAAAAACSVPVLAAAIPHSLPAPAHGAAPAAQRCIQGHLPGLAAWPGGGGSGLGPLAAASTPGAVILGVLALKAGTAVQPLGLLVSQGNFLQRMAAQQALLREGLGTSTMGVVPPLVNGLPEARPAFGGAFLANAALRPAAVSNAPGGMCGAPGLGAQAAPSPRATAATLPVDQALLRRSSGGALLSRGASAAADTRAHDASGNARGKGGAEDACAECGRLGCEGGFWIACDSCNGWFCGRCANMNRVKAAKLGEWFCFHCAAI